MTANTDVNMNNILFLLEVVYVTVYLLILRKMYMKYI